jgi:hypothetical protein
LAGVVAYQKWLKFLAPSQVLKWTTLLGLPPALLQLALITHLNRELGELGRKKKRSWEMSLFLKVGISTDWR